MTLAAVLGKASSTTGRKSCQRHGLTVRGHHFQLLRSPRSTGPCVSLVEFWARVLQTSYPTQFAISSHGQKRLEPRVLEETPRKTCGATLVCGKEHACLPCLKSEGALFFSFRKNCNMPCAYCGKWLENEWLHWQPCPFLPDENNRILVHTSAVPRLDRPLTLQLTHERGLLMSDEKYWCFLQCLYLLFSDAVLR